MSGRRGLSRLAAWVRENRLTLATGVAAAIPVIVAIVRALDARWVPITDNAVVTLRAYDVLTGESPLVGQWSTASIPSIGPTYGLGPLLFWLLAIPERLFGPGGYPVVMGLVNVACVMGSVALARRRGGPALMVAAALGIAFVCRSLPTEVLASPFNPGASLLPFTLLTFLTWSVACGDFRLLPISVAVASLVAQCHIANAVPAFGMLVIAVAGLAHYLLRGPGRAEEGPRGRVRRWMLASLVVGVVCWSAPLIDQVVHDPGNLVVLERTGNSDRPTLGLTTGLRVAVKAVGVPPWWLERTKDPFTRYVESVSAPGSGSVATFVLIVAGLLAALVAGLRYRRDIAIAAALALVQIGSLVVVSAATPKSLALNITYSVWWAAPVGMWAWLVLAFSISRLWPAIRTRSGRAAEAVRAERAPAVLGVAGLLLVAAVAVAVAVDQPPDPTRSAFAPARAMVERLREELPEGRAVRLGGPATRSGFWFLPAVAYGLRREGVRPLVEGQFADEMGAYYRLDGRHYDDTVLIGEGDFPLPPGGRVLLRLPLPAALDQPALAPDQRTVTVAIVPNRAGG